MKRIVYSILIGAGCAFLFWGISKLQENKRKNNGGLIDVFKNKSSEQETFYSAELHIAIGNTGDNIKLIEQTKEQILQRLSGSYTDLSIEKIDKNVYKLKANNIIDTIVFKNAITSSGKIEFSELFTIDEISGSLSLADSILRYRNAELAKRQEQIKEPKKSLDTATDKLSDVLGHLEIEKSNGQEGLRGFISFTQPFPNADGRIRYMGDLGYVKPKDTSTLNQILNDPEITGHFPVNLKFLYGILDVNPYSNDSMIRLYAKKDLDKNFFPYPTWDQITKATPSFQPPDGQPTIELAFNTSGAQAWYLMTERNVNKPVAIIANNVVLTAPVVESAIEGGQSRITGNFSGEETELLCKMMLSGELPLVTRITAASFKQYTSKKFGLALIILILFVLSSAAGYGISFLIKPASKP